MLLTEKIQRLVEIERKRYRTKGFWNSMLAIMLLIGGMWTTITLGEVYWPEQIDDKLIFVFLTSLACQFTISLTSLILHLPGYLGWSEYFDRHQINSNTKKPWQRKNWEQIRFKAIMNILMNQVIISPILFYISLRSGVKVRVEEEMPSLLQVFSQFVIVYYTEDCFFYWSHRLFHSPYLYKMHKVHHQYESLFTWAGLYHHPIDFMLGNMLPSAIAFSLIGKRAHCVTLFYWITWKAYIATQSHSGYEFHWSPMRILPFVMGPAYHDDHHSNNVGNFSGSCYLWDFFFDTNVQFMDRYLKN